MQAMVSVTKALSDRNRLRVIAALHAHSELCACQITELLRVTGATVSRHMGILMRADLVESRKDGRWTFFQLKAPASETRSVMTWLREGFAASSEIEQDRRDLVRILSLDKADLCRRQRGEACCPKSDKVDSGTTA